MEKISSGGAGNSANVKAKMDQSDGHCSRLLVKNNEGRRVNGMLSGGGFGLRLSLLSDRFRDGGFCLILGRRLGLHHRRHLLDLAR